MGNIHLVLPQFVQVWRVGRWRIYYVFSVQRPKVKTLVLCNPAGSANSSFKRTARRGRLIPALCKSRSSKHENQDRLVPGLVKIRFRGLFFWVVVSVGDF